MRITKQKIKILLTPQARPLDLLIVALQKLHLQETFEMVDTRSNIQLADLNSRSHDRKKYHRSQLPRYWGPIIPSTRVIYLQTHLS